MVTYLFNNLLQSSPIKGLYLYTERCDIMELFWFGVIIGGIVMLLSMTIIAAQAVDEKNRQILYLRRQLKEQADAERKEL